MCVPGCREAIQRVMSRRGFFAGAASAGVCAGQAQASRSFSTVVDLTHTLSPAFPTFFGMPGIAIDRRYTPEAGRRERRLVARAGACRHPCRRAVPLFGHGRDGGEDRRPSSWWCRSRWSTSPRRPRATRTTSSRAQDLAEWEEKHGPLPDNCCVAMHSGWAQHATSARYAGKNSGTMHFPGIHPQAAEWLIRERRVAGLAVDTLSLDHGPSRDFRTHQLWLPSGRWGIENIANLDKVPASGATIVVGLPKVKDASGGPARMFALI